MARKKSKVRVSGRFFKYFFILIFISFIGVLAYREGREFLTTSSYFMIRDIAIEPSLDFIKSSQLESLKGKNIFTANLSRLQSSLRRQYPQAADLKIIKRFPDQVAVVAQKRTTLAQIESAGKYIAISEEGAILTKRSQREKNIPVISGISGVSLKKEAGQLINDKQIQIALRLIKEFQAQKTVSTYEISKINVSNLSKIYFYITGDYRITVDQENNLAHKIKLLGLVLAQANPKLKDRKSIDLRFKEPILGKK